MKNGACDAANSSIATVTVDPTSVGGTIAGAATVCTGTNSTLLTLSGHTGEIQNWESSTDINFISPAPTTIANTNTTLTVENLTTTTHYRAVIKSGVCSSVNSGTTTVTVSADPLTVGGTISGATIVCTGTNSTDLTLSGHTGSILRWESATDNIFTSPSTINNTTTSITETNLTQTTYYRAVVQSGVCNLIYSDTVAITVDAASVGGSVSGTTTVCTGTNSTFLVLSGHTGTIQNWESSTDLSFSSPTTIANTTTSYIAEDLTSTTYYRAVVKSGVCDIANSAIATVTVDAASVGGSVSGTSTVCTGTNSTTLTLSGHTGMIQNWESSTDLSFSSPTTITNSTTTYEATNLTATTYYRAVVKSGVCDIANSAIATVTVDAASVGGTLSGSGTVCTGTNSTFLVLSGHTGTIQNWESSTDIGFSSPTTIANTTTSYIAEDLTSTTYYRAVVKSGVCVSANSSIATVTVDAASAGGSVSGTTMVCTGTNSTTLTLSGHTGTIQNWESSTDLSFSSPTTITNSTTTYEATNLTATTYYRAVVKSGVCDIANSAIATVTVDAASVGGSVSGTTTVCTGTNSTTLVLSGHTGMIQNWESSTDIGFSSPTSIANTTTSYTAENLTATTYYRAVVKSGVCVSANSAIATVTVDAASVGAAYRARPRSARGQTARP